MTEEEAKTKWCPFARMIVTLDAVRTGSPQAIASFNRGKDGEMAACLASACMAWRWTGGVIDHPQIAAAIAETERHGYCGLAGEWNA